MFVCVKLGLEYYANSCQTRLWIHYIIFSLSILTMLQWFWLLTNVIFSNNPTMSSKSAFLLWHLVKVFSCTDISLKSWINYHTKNAGSDKNLLHSSLNSLKSETWIESKGLTLVNFTFFCGRGVRNSEYFIWCSFSFQFQISGAKYLIDFQL